MRRFLIRKPKPTTAQVSPLEFFGHLKWLDRTPLLGIIEPYRQKIFMDALYTFDADGRPKYNRILAGRAKKNWKTTDLILAGLYRFLAWQSTSGNDCAVIANDEGQAADDLSLLKKLIAVNPLLADEVEVQKSQIVRQDGKGKFVILPAGDVVGLHGKTFLFLSYDEIHGYRNYDVLEALAMDPTRLDSVEWITSYASIFHTPGAPLFDLVQMGKRGDDPRMYFSWYASDYSTDPALEGEHISPEQRANPSLASWNNPGYLAQQKRRLPTHKFRRLHLNLPGMPDGSFFNAERVLSCTIQGRKLLKPQLDIEYQSFVDMSGGSSDDATLGIAHTDKITGRGVLDVVISQTGPAPFNPRDAVRKFAALLKDYRCYRVVGDRYAGETFRADFLEHRVQYEVSNLTKHQIYEALEPRLNAGEVELLDVPKMQEQLLGLVVRGMKIDHLSGEHDDWINAAAGALWLTAGELRIPDDSIAMSVNREGVVVSNERTHGFSAFDGVEEQARQPEWLRQIGGTAKKLDWGQ